MIDLTRNWTGRCYRCGKKVLNHTMSQFNTDLLCLGCADDEKRHPDYSKAVNAERDALKQGNFNFPGIGWTGMPKPVAPSDSPADIFGG